MLTLLLVGAAATGCTSEESFPDSLGASTTSESISTPGSTPGDGPSAATEPLRLSSLDPALLVGNFVICSDCHGQVDQPGVVYAGLTSAFQHRFHIANGATCDACHVPPTHTKEGIRTPPMEKCFECHSQEDPSAPPGECDACHPEDFSLTPVSHADPEWLPAVELRESLQGLHSRTKIEDRQKECGLCHGPDFCGDCHKVEMPHPGGWQESHMTEAKKVGGFACNLCHVERQICAECHHTGYKPGGPPWIELHPTQALAEGPERCIGCHSTKTCSHCHVTGEYKEYD